MLIYTVDQTFLCNLIFKQKINGTQINPSYTLIFILFLGVSYSLGYLLTPFGHYLGKYTYIDRQYKEKLDECSDEHYCGWLWKECLGKDFDKTKSVKELTPEEIESLFQCQHDQVRIKCPDLIRSLAKSQADVQLSINTSAAFLIISVGSLFVSIISVIAPAWELKKFWINCILFFLFAVGFWFAAYYRNERFLKRQFSFSKEAQKREMKDKRKEKDGGLFSSILNFIKPSS